jgi:hypothetical protein
MQFQINFPIPEQSSKIFHEDDIMLIGSCFTENISKKLQDRKFNVLHNPHGILFNPISVCACIRDIVRNQEYNAGDLFYLNEMWSSWNHHSRFSGITPIEALDKINSSIAEAHRFLMGAKWMIITLGSAYAYRHNDLDMHVSNNHRAPDKWFTKELLNVNFIVENIQHQLGELQEMNPELQIIFTISPVRHLRDGVVENNRSKARLIEAVHLLVAKNKQCHYFPSYEIVIDELRDYRFFDIDLAHPNYTATEYVWQKFVEACIHPSAHALMQEVYQLKLAMQHKPQNPTSQAHQEFLKKHFDLAKQLKTEYSYLDFSAENKYFSAVN